MNEEIASIIYLVVGWSFIFIYLFYRWRKGAPQRKELRRIRREVIRLYAIERYENR